MAGLADLTMRSQRTDFNSLKQLSPGTWQQATQGQRRSRSRVLVISTPHGAAAEEHDGQRVRDGAARRCLRQRPQHRRAGVALRAAAYHPHWQGRRGGHHHRPQPAEPSHQILSF